MDVGRLFFIRLAEAILAVFLHMFQMVEMDATDNFAAIIQNTAYSCWVIIIGARFDAQLFDFDGLEFPSEVFASLGGSVCYMLAAISSLLNLKAYNYSDMLITKSIFAMILSILLMLEFIILVIDQ